MSTHAAAPSALFYAALTAELVGSVTLVALSIFVLKVIRHFAALHANLRVSQQSFSMASSHEFQFFLILKCVSSVVYGVVRISEQLHSLYDENFSYSSHTMVQIPVRNPDRDKQPPELGLHVRAFTCDGLHEDVREAATVVQHHLKRLRCMFPV